MPKTLRRLALARASAPPFAGTPAHGRLDGMEASERRRRMRLVMMMVGITTVVIKMVP